MPFMGRTRVESFGYPDPHYAPPASDVDAELRRMREEDEEAREGTRSFKTFNAGRAALAQVRLHWQDDEQDPQSFVIELIPDSPDRILLARVDPEDTLQKTWEKVARLVTEDARPLPPFARFEIPKIDVGKKEAFFRELTGPIHRSQPPDWYLENFGQWTRFRLDEQGARLESFAFMTMSQILGSEPTAPSYVFDRPFLVALMQRGTSRPYFLLWIANADLLVEVP